MKTKDKIQPGAMTNTDQLGRDPDSSQLQRENWTPLNGGVSISLWKDEKGEGIEIRGCKNTQKGKRSRGPMA